MGLFSDEYVTTVGTQAMRIIADKSIMASSRVGMLKSQYAEQPQMMEYVMEEMSGSLAHKGERMYSYAKKNYPVGLPSGQIKSAVDGIDVVKAALASIKGGTINIDYIQLGAPNLQHRGWIELVKQLQYDPVSNKIGTLTATKGKDVYLTDMVVVVKAANLDDRTPFTLAQWGPPATAGFTPNRLAQLLGTIGKYREHTKFEVDPGATRDYVRVEFIYANGTVYVEDHLNIELPPMDDGDYYQVRYDYGLNLSKTDFWIYKVGSGTFPAVDNIHITAHNDHGTYFPMAYVRYAKKSASEGAGTAEYKATEKMLKIMNMNYADMIKQINSNPDIADVEQAIVAMCVPAITENEAEQNYLFDYFKQLFYAADAITPDAPQNQSMWMIIDAMFPELQQSRTIIIQDKKFKTSLSFNNISQEIKVGNVCPVGEYTSEFLTETKVETPPLTTGGTTTYTTLDKRHVYQHQIALGLYEEISVYGLRVTYYVYGNYSTVGIEKDAILLIPLDNSITSKYTTLKREELYSRSLHLIVNSRVVTVLKWYQQDWFKIFTIIVMVVITILSLGSTWQGLVAAIAAGASGYAIAYMIFIAILKYMVVSFLVKLFVKLVGVKFAFIVAIIAAIAGSYDAVQSGSVEGAPWASDLLKISTSLAKGIQDNLANSMLGLQEDADRYKLYTDTKVKLLDDANKLLESSDPLIPMIIWGEKPDDFYNRTVHSGNIGAMGLDMIESYCEVKLKLPELQDTLGVDNYGLPNTSPEF